MSTTNCLRLLLFFFFFGQGTNSIAQLTTDDLLSKTWEFKMITTIPETDAYGTAVPAGTTQQVGDGFNFRIVNILSNGDLVIKFLRWPVATTVTNGVKSFSATAAASTNAQLNERLYMSSFTTNDILPNRDQFFRYFRISRSDFDVRCRERLTRHQLSIGAMTLPIKMRFAEKQNGINKSYSNFTGNISLGLSVGYKRNYTRRFALSALTGFSLSSVPVSPETTNNEVLSETNQAAVTWHLGGLMEIDNFQLGIFTGIDYLSGKINSQWVYRNKPWLGVGIGFSFFNTKSTKDTQ